MEALLPWILGLVVCAGLVGWLAVAFIRVLRAAMRRSDELDEDTDPGSRATGR